LKLGSPDGLMRRALLGVIVVLAAALLRVWPLQNMGTHLAYITFYPAVALAALYGGRVSGLLATVLSALVVYVWQFASGPNLQNEVYWEGMAIFIATGVIMAHASEVIFRERARALRAAEIARLEKRRAEEAERAERKIAESEFRFRALFENSPTGMGAVDSRTLRFVRANLNAQSMYGYSEDELRSKTVDELTHPDDRAESKQYNERLAQGLIDNYFIEKRYLRKDGSFFWAEVGVSALKGADGGVELLIGSMVDISARREAEAALTESEQTYRSLFENMLNGFAYCRMLYEDGRPADFIYLNVNSAFATQTGLKDVTGKKVSEVIPGIREADPGLLEIYGRVAATGVPERFEYFVVALQMWFSISVYSPQRGYFVAVFDVITERKRAEERIAAHVKQLEDAVQGTLQAVSNMVEQRDPYTAGHERRVGLIAADIAREMGWPENKCRELRQIGLVCDIGKIAIPAEILVKAGPLTDTEYKLVKGHAEKGYEILKGVKFPMPVAEIIRQHHERMDGSGYPRGLKGEEIFPEARVLAVADVLEAMTSHRPYRAAFSKDETLKELSDHRGVGFDAAVVDAVLTLIREKGYQLPP
jgi:PAS domain S-box-containing protein